MPTTSRAWRCGGDSITSVGWSTISPWPAINSSPMFNSITNAQDGFHRHHNAKPLVRRSVLYHQFLPSICLGGASNPGGGENTQQPIFGLQYLTLLIFVLGGQQSRQRRKHSTTNIWTAVLDNYLFFSLCTPPSVHVNQYAAWYTPIVNLIQDSYCQQTCRTYTSKLFHPIC